MLTLEQLSFAHRENLVLDKICLQFQPGKVHGILGPNGSGKSTLLKTISAIWKPTFGQVMYNHTPLHQLERKALSRVVSMVSQELHMNFEYTCYEIVAMGRYPLEKEKRSLDRLMIEKALKKVDGWQFADRPIQTLSRGEKQRISLAKALVSECPILLLDEPCTALDLRHQLENWELFQTLASQGKTIIITTHDLHQVERYCDTITVLHKGRVKKSGNAKEMLSPEILYDVFGVYPITPRNFSIAG